MRHIPYGYRIENGRAVIDEEQAATVREFFQNYISGMALVPAAEKVGLKLYHGSAGRMLRNKKYLGDDYYPAIVDKETFDRAEEIRRSRAKALGRVWELEGKKDIPFLQIPGKHLGKCTFFLIEEDFCANIVFMLKLISDHLLTPCRRHYIAADGFWK